MTLLVLAGFGEAQRYGVTPPADVVSRAVAYMNAEIPKHLKPEEEEDIDTLGGLVFALLGRVPARGELIRHPAGLEFEVLDADPRRVKKLRIHHPRPKDGPAPAKG